MRLKGPVIVRECARALLYIIQHASRRSRVAALYAVGWRNGLIISAISIASFLLNSFLTLSFVIYALFAKQIVIKIAIGETRWYGPLFLSSRWEMKPCVRP